MKRTTTLRALRQSGTCLAVAIAVAFSPTVWAQARDSEVRELRLTVQSLAQKIEALEAEQQAAGETVKAGALPGSFLVPGSQTSIKFNGFAALDFVQDLSGGGMGGIIAQPQAIVFGTAQEDRNGQLSMSARRSRLGVQTLTPSRLGDIKTVLEADFIGIGGNELVTNSASLRLRHAYVQIGSTWLFGQSWTNFADLATFPETVNFQGGHGMLQGIRQPQVRYSHFSGAHEVAVALENPEADFWGMQVAGFNPSVGPVPSTHMDKVPDLTLRYAYNADWGRVAVSALGRRLQVDNRGQAPINGFVGKDDVFAGGAGIAARIKAGGRNSIQLGAQGGRGMGRYILGAPMPVSAAIVNGELEAVDVWGAMVGYQHHWNETLRSNITYGTVHLDLPRQSVPQTVPSRVDAMFVNLFWTPVPRLTLGVEFARGEVENDAATNNKASASLLGGTVTYAF